MKHFITLTLVRVKRPGDFQDRFGRRPEAEDMETVNVDMRVDSIFSITNAHRDISPPLVNALVGVRSIGEFAVAETRDEVHALLSDALDSERRIELKALHSERDTDV